MLAYLDHILGLIADYPHLVYAAVFFAALSESIPILGAVIPGSTAIIGMAALVPTGAVGFWPVLGSAVAGAVVSDGFSYWLGKRYHRPILSRWPFTRYPQLTARSEDFFRRHGGSSVFLGRFVPALRAFVPLFAGILGMRAGRFYLWNVLSALFWAPAHVLPGVLVGASLVLAGAVAGRLLLFIAALLVVLLLALWLVRLALRFGSPVLARAVERARVWSKGDGQVRRLLRSILDPDAPEARGLVVAGLVLVGASWLFLAILEDVVTGDPLVRADAAIYGLLQVMRTPWGDAVMVVVTELGDALVTASVTAAVLLWLLARRAWRTAGYWVAAVAMASLFNTGIKLALHRARPAADLFEGWSAFSFPSGHATVNVALWGFLAFLVARPFGAAARSVLIGAVTVLVASIAFSRLYLGAHWFSDVIGGLAFASAWIALLSIAYRHHRPEPIHPKGLLVLAGIALIVSGGVNVWRDHGSDLARYAIQKHLRVVDMSDWRAGGWRTLPISRIDLKGETEAPFDVHWAGAPTAVLKTLEPIGWRRPAGWTPTGALAWLLPNVDAAALPVLPQLHDGRLPVLTMVLPQSDERLVLRLWVSNVELRQSDGSRLPLLIGTVFDERLLRMGGLLTMTRSLADLSGPRDRLAAGLASGGAAAIAKTAPEAFLVARPDARDGSEGDGGILLVGPAPPTAR